MHTILCMTSKRVFQLSAHQRGHCIVSHYNLEDFPRRPRSITESVNSVSQGSNPQGHILGIFSSDYYHFHFLLILESRNKVEVQITKLSSSKYISQTARART